MTTQGKLTPVIGSGEYACEYDDCEITQDGEGIGDILFYGDDNGMYCKEHVVVFSPNQKLFIKDAESQGYEVELDYSGRGMYGKTCPAVRFGRDENHLKVITHAKTKEDGMGMGYIVYAQY